MKVTALAAHTPEAVRAALAARGWETQPAWFAATGIEPLVVLIEETTEDEREALVHWGAKSGADVLTGNGWALVAGAASRLAPLARYDRAPAELGRLAPVLGRILAARADAPRTWAIRGGGVPPDKPIIIGILNVNPDSFSDGGRLSSGDGAGADGARLTAGGRPPVECGRGS